ncbi:MAG TPA: hypothetical protein VGD98_23135 [Ktedonobacteraceae bacterium]
MMETDHALPLSPTQAEQLAHACAAYRSYAWQQLPPTQERNHLMKMAQAVQGRLLETQAAQTAAPVLRLTSEERQALRVIISVLMQVYGLQSPSVARNRWLGDLAALRILFERSRHNQAS